MYINIPLFRFLRVYVAYQVVKIKNHYNIVK